MKTLEYNTDLCVVGGGLAGLCCAVSAARHGIKTVLVHDRIVLGGNASSEIRMWVCGANGTGVRETGIVEELMLENYYRNPQHSFSVWDTVLYETAMKEQNLTLLLNSSCLDATMDGDTIVSIKAWQSNAETFHVVKAKYFADCSGDSILAPLTNAKFMYGREAKSEFNETIPPDVADKKTMGMSCLFQFRETDHKVEFVKPDWAYTYETDADLPYKDHNLRNNFWWIEIGGEWDCIHDTDKCRDELLKISYGVWDHMKNKGDHGADNMELDWVGFLPGKRESRRYVGKHVITQNDVQSEGRFEDMIAYAGWTMDDHFPEGFYYRDGHPTIYHPAPSPWGIPLRALVSENITNLVFAGRNISVTHAALSSSRVMATCAVMGEALGIAVSEAVKNNCAVEKVNIQNLQKLIMADDMWLPWHDREVSPLSISADCSADIVRNGKDRLLENCWIGKSGDFVTYTFDKPQKVSGIRLIFDSDLDRKYDNMPCRFLLDEKGYFSPKTLIKEYRVEGVTESGEILSLVVNDNRHRFVKHAVDWTVKSVRFVPVSTHGDKDFRVFSFEVE